VHNKLNVAPPYQHSTFPQRVTMTHLIMMFQICPCFRLLGISPDTGDLTMRIGLHSGPVTAGVLRGEKSRFQLFGDTVNTAARIESTGARSKIHISQETADLIVADGKSKWIKPRDKAVSAKGKGSLTTFWLDIKGGSVHSDPTSTGEGGGDGDGDDDQDDDLSESGNANPKEKTEPGDPRQLLERNVPVLDARTRKLVDWSVDVLKQQIKKIVVMRDPKAKSDPFAKRVDVADNGSTVIHEVQEIITLPDDIVDFARDLKGMRLDDKITDQLVSLVSTIASMYRDVPFHNFDHASHVTMSVTKLLSRVVTPSDMDIARRGSLQALGETNLHEYTYGITSDPLCQFALSFAALIHDVDHHGVPNAQLVKENTEMAKKYNNQSVAEQNSVDMAWDLFMQPQYLALRECICYTRADQQRFRALVVNAVMATDIVDKELGALRKHRWAVAFQEEGEATEDKSRLTDRNRKATIVIEHMIQASDVAHTMQHWHVYQKWNEKFFRECRAAYLAGRAEKDPAEGWYQGELGFFDFYIIPLANKLKECGCFGVSCDEYLNYALANRNEWERKGKAIVAGYVGAYQDVGDYDNEPPVEAA
jgi:hypothetical protein